VEAWKFTNLNPLTRTAFPQTFPCPVRNRSSRKAALCAFTRLTPGIAISPSFVKRPISARSDRPLDHVPDGTRGSWGLAPMPMKTICMPLDRAGLPFAAEFAGGVACSISNNPPFNETTVAGRFISGPGRPPGSPCSCWFVSRYPGSGRRWPFQPPPNLHSRRSGIRSLQQCSRTYVRSPLGVGALYWTKRWSRRSRSPPNADLGDTTKLQAEGGSCNFTSPPRSVRLEHQARLSHVRPCRLGAELGPPTSSTSDPCPPRTPPAQLARRDRWHAMPSTSTQTHPQSTIPSRVAPAAREFRRVGGRANYAARGSSKGRIPGGAGRAEERPMRGRE